LYTLVSTTDLADDVPAVISELEGDRDSTHGEISSRKMVTIAVTWNIVLLSVVLPLLLTPEEEEPSNIGAGLVRGLIEILVHFILIATSAILAIFQFLPQIRRLISMRTSGNLSMVSLSLQIPVLLLLAVFQVLPMQPYDKWIIPWWGWFMQVGNVSVNYVFTALGEMVLLGLYLYFEILEARTQAPVLFE
jgi:hypothetical protein